MNRDGLVLGMEDREYHSGPELSSTGAKKILKSPATFRHYIDNPQPGKLAFDVGHAAHAKVLGVGAPIIEYPKEHITPGGNVSTKAATVTWADEQRALGFTPISPDDRAAIDLMAEAVLSRPDARAILEQPGDAEVSLFATDPETGVRMRARFDFAPKTTHTDPVFADVKTVVNADEESFAKVVADLGYDVQQEHYMLTRKLVTGDASGRMKFIAVEKTAPYLVQVHELSEEFAIIGAARARKARRLFAAATASGVWSGYEPAPLPLQPPMWHVFQNMELTEQ